MTATAPKYNGQLTAPASKSHGQRLLILAALANSACLIQNLGKDRDTQAMQAALKNTSQQLADATEAEIHVGESGFALRTLAFVGASFYPSYQLTGSGTLLLRTHWATIQLLEQIGFEVRHQDGKLPLSISKHITHTKLEVDGTEGSQYVSGLFLLAAKEPGSWEITIKNLNSQAYFEMTLAALRQFGFVYEQTGTTYIFDGAQELSCPEVSVEGDWSSAAAHLVAAAINGSLQISGLNAKSLQPDQNLLAALTQFGALCLWNGETLEITSSEAKLPFDFDCTQQPDLFPVLVVLACAAEGTSKLSGIHRLHNKESDRLKAMCEALTIWGVAHELKEGNLLIHGTGKIKMGQVKTYHDHRIVMAACIANMLADAYCVPDDTSALQKSYPGFLTDFERFFER
jgi:3-phosphoshikimate 1-carboxyvinyltransferase